MIPSISKIVDRWGKPFVELQKAGLQLSIQAYTISEGSIIIYNIGFQGPISLIYRTVDPTCIKKFEFEQCYLLLHATDVIEKHRKILDQL